MGGDKSLSALVNGHCTTLLRHRPCVKYHDPITMESVAVKSATALDANEVLVIYRYDKESQKVSRRIQHGPCVYFPAANEWLAGCFIRGGNGVVVSFV